MNTSLKQIDEAKALLKSVGYFTDNLWHIDDVKSLYKCTDEQAYEVLEDALNTDTSFESVWESVNMAAINSNLERKTL